jgi:hypothetical protein
MNLPEQESTEIKETTPAIHSKSFDKNSDRDKNNEISSPFPTHDKEDYHSRRERNHENRKYLSDVRSSEDWESPKERGSRNYYSRTYEDTRNRDLKYKDDVNSKYNRRDYYNRKDRDDYHRR